MCTVSFYNDNGRIIITSNRDEQFSRPLAIHPTEHSLNGTRLFFPQDPTGGGSWFVVNENGNVYVLLNGGDKKHIPSYPYRRSRGIVLLELASASDIAEKWRNFNLVNIEPFTTVCYFNKSLYQCTWTGTEKSMKLLNSYQPHIWSSVTLFSCEIIKEREKWFKNYLASKLNILTENDLITFHTDTQLQDSENGLIINRNGTLITKSITQFIYDSNSQHKLLYIDLVENIKSELIIGE